MKYKKQIGLLAIIIVLSIWYYNKRLPLISNDIVNLSTITVNYNENKYSIEVPEPNILNYIKGKCENVNMTFFARREFRERKKTDHDTSNNTLYEIDLYSNVEHLTSMVLRKDAAKRIVYIKLNYMYSNSRVRYEEEMYFDYDTGLISHYFRKYKYNSGLLNDQGYTEVDQTRSIICGDRIIKSVHSSTERDDVDIQIKDIINGRNIIKSVYGMRILSTRIVEQLEL